MARKSNKQKGNENHRGRFFIEEITLRDIYYDLVVKVKDKELEHTFKIIQSVLHDKYGIDTNFSFSLKEKESKVVSLLDVIKK